VRADLHLHTNLSDGQASPELLVFKAAARDLDLVAVTDHDTTAGVAAAVEEGHALGVRVVTGVELSAAVPLPGGHPDGDLERVSVHLICLGFELDHAPLQALLARTRDARVRATRETLEALSLAGYGASLPEADFAPSQRSLGRPHVARALVAAGRARTRGEAFDLFLSGDAYKSRYDLPTAIEAIATVHAAGGIAVYAHPRIDEVDVVAPLLKEWGLDGIEVHRASWPRSPRPLYVAETAKRLDLLPSGGSDWHGTGLSFGEFCLTEETAGRLLRRIA
jgi:predicted metal-dependent phosphoesterase TrpH